jgi:type II secretory pathway component PulF
VAIIVALVLDQLRHDGQQFAKYAKSINSTVDVKEQEVIQYETNLQTQVFDRVRASILDAAEKTGVLGEKLRNLGKFSLSKFDSWFLS